jgi:hypothetical protein
MGGQLHAPVVLPPGKRSGTHCTGGWVGPKAGLDRYVQPVASSYTDYAIPAHIKYMYLPFIYQRHYTRIFVITNKYEMQ